MSDEARSQPKTEQVPSPWLYRPVKHDDWGWIRRSRDDGSPGDLVAVARSGKYESEEALDRHRRDKTDPYEANARLIVEAVNSYASLKEQVAWWEDQCGQAVAENETLKARIQVLESALSECLGQMGWTNYSDDEMRHEVKLGHGKASIILRARAALAGEGK